MSVPNQEVIDTQKILSDMPIEAIVLFLKQRSYIVLDENERIHNNQDIIDSLEGEGYEIVKEEFEDEPEPLAVNLTGSIVDEDIKEEITRLNDKYGFNLANILRNL